jgi:hypothetical protein
MAIAIIGGLLVSTLLSLLFVPAFFVIMADVGRIFSRLIGRVTEEAEGPPLARFTPLRMDPAPQQPRKARIDHPGE